MFRIRSPSILEPKIVNYPLTFVTKCIISFQTLILTVFLAGHLIIICTEPRINSNGNKMEGLQPEDWVRLALYVSFISSLITFFIALNVNKWPLVIPIIIEEVLLLAYLLYNLVVIILSYKTKNTPVMTSVYLFLCLMVMAESPLTVFLSIRVLLYVKTMARAVRTTRQLSYVGSITKESLRKEEELVRMETIKKRTFEAEGVQREPRISIISLPLEDRDNQSTSTVSTIPHIEISDA